MRYINTKTGAYPLSAFDVRKAVANVSLPATPTDATLQGLGFAVVQLTDRPASDRYHTVTEGAPVATDGTWKQVWVVTPLPLDDARAVASDYLNTAAADAIAAGFTYNNVLYQSDAEARQNIIGTAAAVANGIPLPSGFQWRAADNSMVTMTAQDVIGLGAAMLMHVNTQYATCWTLKAKVAVAMSVDELAEITWPTS